MLRDFKPGDTISGLDVIVTDNKGFSFTKDGRTKSVMKYVFSDGEDTIEFVDFDKEAADAKLPEKAVVKIFGTVDVYKGKLQIKNLMTRTSTRDPASFRACSMFDITTLWGRVVNLVATIHSPFLRRIAEDLLVAENLLKLAPAGRTVHNNWCGGLLEHALTMAELGSFACETYRTYFPQINRDLVLFGCLFHDWGKIYEYDIGHPAYQQTVEGELLGHISITANEIYVKAVDIRDEEDRAAAEDKSVQAIYDESLLHQALHVILSHHGKLEYGSPVAPKTIEAILVHQLDMTDTRIMHAYGMMKKQSEGVFTERSWCEGVGFLKQPIALGTTPFTQNVHAVHVTTKVENVTEVPPAAYQAPRVTEPMVPITPEAAAEVLAVQEPPVEEAPPPTAFKIRSKRNPAPPPVEEAPPPPAPPPPPPLLSEPNGEAAADELNGANFAGAYDPDAPEDLEAPDAPADDGYDPTEPPF